MGGRWLGVKKASGGVKGAKNYRGESSMRVARRWPKKGGSGAITAAGQSNRREGYNCVEEGGRAEKESKDRRFVALGKMQSIQKDNKKTEDVVKERDKGWGGRGHGGQWRAVRTERGGMGL